LLKAQISNIEEWQAILTSISEFVEDAIFICSNEGITFRGIDSSQMALLDIIIPKSSFDKLICKTSFFSLKIMDFKTIMNFALPNDVIEFYIPKKTEMKIFVKGSIITEYTIKLIQRKKVDIPLPDGEYKSKLILKPDTITRILNHIQQISKEITIHCNSKRVIFSGQGNLGDAKINLSKSNPDLKDIKSTEISSAVYNLEYMAKIIRNIGKASKIVNIEYSNKNPVHIMFDMYSKTKVNYYLAPKIEK